MFFLFFLLSILTLIAIIIGLINPKIVIFWGDKEKRTRKKVLLYYGLSTFLLFVLFVVSVPELSEERKAELAQEREERERPREEAKVLKAAEAESKEVAKQEAKAKEEAEKAAREQEAREAKERDEAEKAAKKEADALNLLTEAKVNFNNQEYDIALSKLNEALKNNPNLEEAKSLIPEVNEAKMVYQEELAHREMLNYMSSTETMEYRVVSKNPDSHQGKRVEFYGEIAQIVEDRNNTFILLSVTHHGYGFWSDNIAVFFDGTIDAYDGDLISIYGEVEGAYSYDSVAGWRITVPSVQAKYITTY